MYKQSTLDSYWNSESFDIENDIEEYIPKIEEEIDEKDHLVRFKNLYWSRLISL